MPLTGFLTRLVLAPTGAGWTKWEVCTPLRYQGRDQEFTVPAGFVTDLASVPRVFWMLMPPFGPWSMAAVIHDRLYQTHEVSRKDADGIFLRIMVASGTKLWRAAIAHRMVRWFGGRAWANGTT